MYIKDFKIIRPKYQQSQEELLEWIVDAHVHSKMQLNQWSLHDDECKQFAAELRDNLFRVGIGKDKIQNRGYQIQDCQHKDWENMEIYNLKLNPEGSHLDKRMDFFNEASSQIFEKMYPQGETLPPHLVHVTCTGYVSPSPAQKLVSLRKAGKNTTVTNAYHMGCYAAIPAIRMAMGHYSLEQEQTDIVHTELSSLHMNPTFHSMEQLVVQSLFADGFIKYSVGEKTTNSPSLKILGVVERIIEDSTTKMMWNCNYWGFQMSLSRDIPVLLRRNLEDYLVQLAKKCGIDREDLRKAHYALHPGGPKIIENIADKLELKPEQISHSATVLQNYGNMSSATLPHIWDRMLKDDSIQPGQRIVSLAFGPGLSMCGAVFEKR